jgi:tetratricopeptide (TPR) repeat protein
MRPIAGVRGIAVFATLAILVLSCRPAESDEGETDGQVTAERQRVQGFWSAYRQATSDRVAGRISEAATQYRIALELNPEHRDALYYLGSVNFDLGEFAEAETVWIHLLEVDPQGSRGYARLGDLYMCFEQPSFFDLDNAKEVFLRSLEINRGETGPLLRLGELAVIRGDLDTALGYLDAVAATNFRSVPAFFFRGYVAWKRGQSTEALDHFREASLQAKPAESIAGAPTEGDTESGVAILAAKRQCQSFRAFTEGLPDPDDENLATEMTARYEAIEIFLSAAVQ